MSDETTPVSEHGEEEGQETSISQVTRRQFLIGAGVGAAVGAAGVAGAFTLAKPVTDQIKAGTPGEVKTEPKDLPPNMRRLTLNINGKDHDVTVEVNQSMWEVMTYQLGMVGANIGCDRAQCGACTIVVDGLAVMGCTVLAARLGRGQKIITIEGLAKGSRLEDLHPVQRAYQLEGGYQCGICTRGFIMSTYALLQTNKNPNDDDIREALAGNICRCAEYPKVFNAVARAAKEMRGGA